MKDSIKRSLFPKKQEKIDTERIRYNQLLEQMQVEKEKPDGIKRAVNINIFREETRRQQGQFHQQNHEFLKMCGIMVRSSFDEVKFDNKFKKLNNKADTLAKGNVKSNSVQKKAPLVHIALDNVEFSCSLISSKFPIKDLYQLFPIRRQSIIFQAFDGIAANHIFFLYEHENAAADGLRYKLESTIEEGIVSQFKNSINKAFKNITFYDYLYFINRKSIPSRSDRIYPEFIGDIAAVNSLFLQKMEEDQKQLFNHDAIEVNQTETCERIISCEQSDIIDNGQNLCFETLDEYSEYKKHKAVEFKNQKVYEKDVVINTNIRNIISTQKIYMVQIIQQVKSYIQLSQQCDGTAIMSRVYEHLINKADQYLRLLCSYTDSKILTIYNIENYQEKIYTFLEKSIRYKKELRNISPELLKQFPVLQIWFKLPDNLLGYTRQQLHETFYELMQAILVFEQKMKANDLYQSLKIKRQGVKYYLK